jgi:DNA excision repair protein ERCC-2
MQIDSANRTVQLSVRELANFRQIPHSSKLGGQTWRAGVGQQWHKTAEGQTQAQHPTARFEVSLSAKWKHKEWQFTFKGRIDQLIPDGSGLMIREVKTVRALLPASAETLFNRYPDYFTQAASYLQLARVLPEFAGMQLAAELYFIDIENGAVQAVPLTQADEDRFSQQLEQLLPFLNDRRQARLRLNDANIKPAFAQLRPGQAELFKSLELAALQAKSVLLQAPTGFGKTGVVLQHALQQMKAGLYQRCIYLTSKSSGQLETIRQLQRMLGGELRYLQMRNRAEHRIDSAAHSCSGDTRCEDELGLRWSQADIHPMELFEQGTVSLESAKALGAETGVCPYALSRGCLPFAELWVGDSNYIFSPASQSVFFEAQGFDAAETLLIIDEAHNLPQRAADALSVEFKTGEFLFALEALQSAAAPRRLIQIGQELSRVIEAQASGQALSANAIYEILDLSEDFSLQLKETQLDHAQIAPFALELSYRIPQLAQALAGPNHEWLHWLPSAGYLRATCLDARSWIAQCISPFASSILMSATLNPIDAFSESCGLAATQAVHIQGHTPWRESAYEVAVDCRVDTRFKKREAHYETTARTVSALCQYSPAVPVAVFFPSYQYAENIRTYLEAVDPGLRILLQPRAVDLAAQENFIDEGLLMADALFLILGSSYAEGVDKLGGRIDQVMVVGPALPEVNAVQQAKIDAHPSISREAAFRDVYIIPAMRRIHQALGRIVRAPGQQARVLLHGRRYTEAAYQQQLAPEYQTQLQIKNETQLHEWLLARNGS